MTDDRVIEYLRTRSRVEPEPDLVARVMAAVDAAPLRHSPFAAFLPAASIAGAVAIVIALAILLGQGRNVGPDPTQSPEARPSSVGELRDALTSAYAALREAPGVEGVVTSSILGELSAATWFSWRPGGDQIVIFRTDLDVAESGWWLESDGQPRARGENVNTAIHVLVGDEYFVADADTDTWVVQARADAPPILSLPTGILDDDPSLDVLAGTNAGDEVSVARDPAGRTTWTMVSSYRDGSVVSVWEVGPDGALVSWSYELVDVSVPATLDFHPLPSSARAEFTRLADAEPLEAPDSASPPDPPALGLPEDFPLGPGDADR